MICLPLQDRKSLRAFFDWLIEFEDTPKLLYTHALDHAVLCNLCIYKSATPYVECEIYKNKFQLRCFPKISLGHYVSVPQVDQSHSRYQNSFPIQASTTAV